MTRETVLLLMIALAVVLLAVGVVAWLRRTRRDSALPAPVGEIPAGAATTASFSGLYVASTRHGEPLERLAIAGLGFRARAGLVVTGHGVALELAGSPRMFLGTDRLTAVARATVAIDRVVEKDGLVRLTWRAGDVLVDSYFRPQQASARVVTDAIIAALPGAASTTVPTTLTGTDA